VDERASIATGTGLYILEVMLLAHRIILYTCMHAWCTTQGIYLSIHGVPCMVLLAYNSYVSAALLRDSSRVVPVHKRNSGAICVGMTYAEPLMLAHAAEIQVV